MATCANCIHHSLCDYNTNISGNGKVRLVYAEGADVKCSFFQNAADVAPKSEVESIITEIADFIWQGESEKMNFPFNDHYYNKQEFIAELKKKYTEEEHDG